MTKSKFIYIGLMLFHEEYGYPTSVSIRRVNNNFNLNEIKSTLRRTNPLQNFVVFQINESFVLDSNELLKENYLIYTVLYKYSRTTSNVDSDIKNYLIEKIEDVLSGKDKDLIVKKFLKDSDIDFSDMDSIVKNINHFQSNIKTMYEIQKNRKSNMLKFEFNPVTLGNSLEDVLLAPEDLDKNKRIIYKNYWFTDNYGFKYYSRYKPLS